ncbi:MAG TPA: CHRD domain-containing protein [Gemmatimonadaceae bacterium]|nr:CHRD domain-containing protein [Gemmatimonadaceae bacterium]
MRMLRHLLVVSLAVGFTVACDDDPEAPEAEVYTATLTGASETPPVTTTATGTATFTVTGNNVSYAVTITGWPTDRTVTAAHIHAAPATGQPTGSPILPFDGGNAMTTAGGSGTIAASQAVIDQIRAGGTYFNVHSSVNAGGEIRGALVPQ